MQPEVSWRRPPTTEMERDESLNCYVIQATSREFTKTCGKDSHEPRWCACIANYGAQTLLPLRAVYDLNRLKMADEYVRQISAALEALVGGDRRCVYKRAELEPVTDAGDFRDLAPLPYAVCKRCQISAANTDNAGYCTLCEVEIVSERQLEF